MALLNPEQGLINSLLFKWMEILFKYIKKKKKKQIYKKKGLNCLKGKLNIRIIDTKINTIDWIIR